MLLQQFGVTAQYVVSQSILDSYVRHSMAEICPNGYASPGDNHCAHFVAHVLQLNFGLTCAAMRGKSGGANIRVAELFDQCVSTQEVQACPTTGQALIFVSDQVNFFGSPTHIKNVRKKHVGIMHAGRVWHYSNHFHRVIVQTVGEFLSHYPKQHNAMWYGTFPVLCRPTTFGTCS